MIKIGTKARFQLTARGLDSLAEVSALLTYLFDENPATGRLTYRKGFGDKADYTYGTDTGVIAQINGTKLVIECYAYGGMTGLTFDETDKKAKPKNAIDDCINFTLSMVKKLIKAGLIEPRKGDLND